MSLKEIAAKIEKSIQEKIIDTSVTTWIAGIDDESGITLLAPTEAGRKEIAGALEDQGIYWIRMLSLEEHFNLLETRRVIEHGKLVVEEVPGWVSWNEVQNTVASHPADSLFRFDTKHNQIHLHNLTLKEVAAKIEECIQEQLIDASVTTWIAGIDDDTQSQVTLLTPTEWGRKEITEALKDHGLHGIRVLSLEEDLNHSETRQIIKHGKLVVEEVPGWIGWSEVQKIVASHSDDSRFRFEVKSNQIHLEP